MKHVKYDNNLPQHDKHLLMRCSNEIKKIDPSVQIILYGSRARGDYKPDSDYDLLILTDGEATLRREDRFRNQIYDIELETGAVLTVRLINKEQWESSLYKAMPFHQNVEKDGVIL